MELKRILVGVDFRPASLQAAQWSAALAAGGARLELAHVMPAFAPGDVRAVHRRLGAGLAGFAATLGGRPAHLHVRRGEPARELLSLAAARRAGLLVLGRHGHGADGETWAALLRNATVPVLGIAEGARPPARVLAAVDEGGSADAVLDAALALASLAGGELVLAHVVRGRAHPSREPVVHRWLAARLHDRAAGSRVAARTVVRAGEPATELLRLLEEKAADVVVLGRGTPASPIVRAIARSAPGPLLVVPPTLDAAPGPRPARARARALDDPLPAA